MVSFLDPKLNTSMRASKPNVRTIHIKSKNKKLVPFLLKPYPSGLRLPNLNHHCLNLSNL